MTATITEESMVDVDTVAHLVEAADSKVLSTGVVGDEPVVAALERGVFADWPAIVADSRGGVTVSSFSLLPE